MHLSFLYAFKLRNCFINSSSNMGFKKKDAGIRAAVGY